MRFSLATLVLLVLWIGAMMCVWVRREPWVLSAIRSIPSGSSHPTELLSISPDKGRYVIGEQHWANQLFVFSNGEPPELLCSFGGELPKSSISPSAFVDEHTIEAVLIHVRWTERDERSVVTFRRRFPEWWWGHFYRPEVWLALGLSVALGWRAVRAIRNKTGRDAPRSTAKEETQTAN